MLLLPQLLKMGKRKRKEVFDCQLEIPFEGWKEKKKRKEEDGIGKDSVKQKREEVIALSGFNHLITNGKPVCF